MAISRITFANRAYGRAWLKNLRRQAPDHFAILRALVDEIVANGGGDVVKADLYARPHSGIGGLTPADAARRVAQPHPPEHLGNPGLYL